MSGVELFGMVATATVVISFFFNDLLLLRIVNGVGAAMFVAYGCMILSCPVVTLNLILLLIQVCQAIKLLKSRKNKFNQFFS